jgi:hypothetical protein
MDIGLVPIPIVRGGRGKSHRVHFKYGVKYQVDGHIKNTAPPKNPVDKYQESIMGSVDDKSTGMTGTPIGGQP